MRRAQASRAKLAELLDEVEWGQTLVATRHGKSGARIMPDEEPRRADSRGAIAETRELGKGAGKVTVVEILERREGRR